MTDTLPVLDDTCPSCTAGHVHVETQAYVTVRVVDGTVVLDPSEPTTDDFIVAECDNPACTDALAQEPGDGRLRHAALTRTGHRPAGDYPGPATVEDEPELEAAWVRVVEAMLA